MWPFKKNKVIDLTGRELKVPKPSYPNVNKMSDSDYQDLTSSDSGSSLGFLGSLAAASSSNSGSASDLISRGKSSPEHLRVRIEDMEYKINALKNRIDKILDRLDLAEKKIDRFERR